MFRALSFTTFVLIGCASESEPGAPSPRPDAAVDALVDAASTSESSVVDAFDSAVCEGAIRTGNGETCVGFGASAESCPTGCGQPYGYVCFGGPPPGFSGCRETRVSATLGNSYCCPKNECVAQPDRDGECSAVSGTPRRFQCPPDGTGGHVTPAAGCVEHGSGATALERFYCCP